MIGLLHLSTFLILAPKGVAEVSFPWKDDFNYETLDEMKVTGWTLNNEWRMSLFPSIIRIDNDGAEESSIFYVGHFPSQIYEFSVETKSRWVGGAYGRNGNLYVWTRRHFYCWYGDCHCFKYAFLRDGDRVLLPINYTSIMNEWTTFALEKKGNTFYMYQDGELKSTYIESDIAPDELVGVSIGYDCYFISTMEYDYISVIALGYIPATLDIDPNTLNLGSKGNWITSYIEFPEDYDVNDINVSSIVLNDTVLLQPKPIEIGDYDNDAIPDLMVKFDRAKVIEYISEHVPITQKFMNIELTVTGYLNDGTPFQGTDTIKIISNSKHEILPS